MRKRIIALVLLVAVLTATQAIAATPTFTDVPNAFWAYSDIERCYEKGIVKGVGNNRFDPDNTLTYAQFYTIIARAFYNDEVQASTNSSDDWYSAHIRVLNTKGLLTNYESGAPKIDLSDKALSKGIPRYDMAVLMYNIAKQYGNADSWKTLRGDELNDFSRMPEYYRTAVLWCYAESLLKGYDDNLFHGDYTVTRAQACTVVCRLMDYAANGASQEKPTAQSVGSGQGTGGSAGANPVRPSVTKVAVPTAISGLTYNGTEQTGVAEGEGYTLTGNTATNAGSYTATATLKANYCWADNSTGTKTINWSIAQQKIIVSVCANLTYNGTKQTGVAEGEGYTLSGTCSAVNAGSYTATATPKANYCWEDGSTEAKTVNWSIAKATPVKNGNISVEYYVNGEIVVKSGGMNVSGSFSFSTEPTNGTNAALFTPDDTTNYKSVTVSVSVKVYDTIATQEIPL